jgi:sec-independent protein translocase protein TatA
MMQLLAGIGPLGVPELLIIAFIVVLVFGVGRLPEVGGAIGKSMKEFRKATKDEDGADTNSDTSATLPPASPNDTSATPPSAASADTLTPPVAPSAQADAVFCSECGARNIRGAKFCAECGKPLAAPVS